MGHPAVCEAAVERPLAAVVLAEGQRCTPAELREFPAGEVARWQLPERWTFLEAVPRTSVGTFDEKVLRRQYADGELAVETLA